MNIQTISVVVPCKGCVNDCKFCISNQHKQNYKDYFDYNAYEKRLKYAISNNVTTLVLTGTGEVLQNKSFLENFRKLMDRMNHPFPNIAVQTTGVMLNEKVGQLGPYHNIDLLKRIGVNTISLSVSDVFSDDSNWQINGTPNKLRVPLSKLTKFITDQGFTLRMSLNLTSAYNKRSHQEIINKCKELGAEQITFRELYVEDENTEQGKWIIENQLKKVYKNNLFTYISINGKKLYKLPFGPYVYSLNEMSMVFDDDCMSNDHDADETLKYVILRENGKLYCKWDDKGSIIF